MYFNKVNKIMMNKTSRGWVCITSQEWSPYIKHRGNVHLTAGNSIVNAFIDVHTTWQNKTTPLIQSVGINRNYLPFFKMLQV